MKQQTAVEYFDEQIQERVIAQDIVARKMIIDISMEDYMNIKKQAKEMEKQQIIDAHISGYDSSGESAKDYYDYYYGSNANDKDSNVCNSQTEISDEEIWKASYQEATFAPSFIRGIEWYRKQLKKK